jgi:hypothetical protein
MLLNQKIRALSCVTQLCLGTVWWIVSMRYLQWVSCHAIMLLVLVGFVLKFHFKDLLNVDSNCNLPKDH